MRQSIIRLSSTILKTRNDIAKVLNSPPTWSVADILPKENEVIEHEPDLLPKLLKQSALTTTEANYPKLMLELDNQLIFVKHISEVDTTNIEPLVRIGDDVPSEFDYGSTKLARELQETARETLDDGWKAVDLAAKKTGSFYVVNERLGMTEIDEKSCES